jgi:hypothetical protein
VYPAIAIPGVEGDHQILSSTQLLRLGADIVSCVRGDPKCMLCQLMSKAWFFHQVQRSSNVTGKVAEPASKDIEFGEDFASAAAGYASRKWNESDLGSELWRASENSVQICQARDRLSRAWVV